MQISDKIRISVFQTLANPDFSHISPTRTWGFGASSGYYYHRFPHPPPPHIILPDSIRIRISTTSWNRDYPTWGDRRRSGPTRTARSRTRTRSNTWWTTGTRGTDAGAGLWRATILSTRRWRRAWSSWRTPDRGPSLRSARGRSTTFVRQSAVLSMQILCTRDVVDPPRSVYLWCARPWRL